MQNIADFCSLHHSTVSRPRCFYLVCNSYFNSKQTIYHRTSIEAAYKIAATKQIYGKDGDKCANFHSRKDAGNNVPSGDEITLEFKWNGPFQSNTKPTNMNFAPNILYWVPASQSNYDVEWKIVIAANPTQKLILSNFSNVDVGSCSWRYKTLLRKLKNEVFNQPQIHVVEKHNVRCIQHISQLDVALEMIRESIDYLFGKMKA